MATIDENLRRVPPQSLEAEESVLGGIMLDNTVIDRVIGVLQPDDFYRGAHRKVFRAMVDLIERSEPVDLITLSETLKARGELAEVAGRPSMGKTAIVLNIAEHAALRADVGVAIFSLEMAKEQLAMRMLCSEARVDLARVRTGHLSDREFPKLAMAAGRLGDAPIYIDDTPALSVLELRAKARRLKRDAGAKLGLVIVDYIQLMRSSEGKDNREQEISEISRSLKALAKELGVPVVALSQLNRQVESRNPPIPRLADLRECVTGGTLVMLADGRRVPIAELVGTEPEVLALSKDGRIVAEKSDRVWRVGRKPVFRVTLATGRTVTATARHRLRSGRAWSRVGELRVGDRIAAARSVPEPQEPVVWPDGHVVLLGQLIGDGSYLEHQPLRYTTSSEENCVAVADAARECFGTI